MPIHKHFSWLVLSVALLCSGLAFAISVAPPALNRPANLPIGPIDDCLTHAYLYSRQEDLASECTLNYVHFYPVQAPQPKRPPAEVRIGSYNLFHLGDNQSVAKDYAVIARLMNRWDIVGAQELMPIPADWAVNNQKIYQLLVDKQGLVHFPFVDWQVVRPGYLELLLELRQLDSSWALILQAQPGGEGTTGEMAGFYYRSNVVQLKEWSYCDRQLSENLHDNRPAPNFGCLVQLPERTSRLVSRRAFAAYFQVGALDFIGLTAHVRFRPADGDADLNDQKQELCAAFRGAKECKPKRHEVGRYYEVKAVADQVPNMALAARDSDVIYMGDFNLENDSVSAPYWEAALRSAPGLKVFQDSPTTLSVPNQGLASNYDHFIFDPVRMKGCDLHSIKPVQLVSHPLDPFAQEVSVALSSDGRSRMMDRYRAQYERLVRFQRAKAGDQIRGLSEVELQSLLDSLTRAIERMKKNDVGGLLELMSDHLPVEMTCATGEAGA